MKKVLKFYNKFILKRRLRMVIKEIENHPICGNHYQDSELLNECHKFIVGDFPMNIKIRALQVVDKVMGAGPTTVTAKDVEEYIKEAC
jgi:hypothetical protein